MSDCFDENVMRQALAPYIPEGETLEAGIHAVSKETDIFTVFSKCLLIDDWLVPHEDGGIIALHKKKSGIYDIFLGITKTHLLIVACDDIAYAYKTDEDASLDPAKVPKLTENLPLPAIGTRFALTDIRSCEIKNGLMGAVNCLLTMKNGSYFKLILPKRGGLGGGMPHYAKYRQAIIERLENCR